MPSKKRERDTFIASAEDQLRFRTRGREAALGQLFSFFGIRETAIKIIVFLGFTFLISQGCASLKGSALDSYLSEQSKPDDSSIVLVKEYEEKLTDVMEVIDPKRAKRNMKTYEEKTQADPTMLNRVKLGIVYHEVSLNLFKEGYKGYAKRSFEILSDPELYESSPESLNPFIFSYIASSRALMGSEEGDIGYVNDAFLILDKAVDIYGVYSYAPLFMRASIAENLPWFFFRSGEAKKDFEAIISSREKNKDYASDKIMSFVYLGLAKQVLNEKELAISYLNKSIDFDPGGVGAREMAEELLKELAQS